MYTRRKYFSIGMIVDVIVQPGVGMLALFPSMKYKVWYALGEFIDNSLGSFQEHRSTLESAFGKDFRLVIEVIMDRESGVITVTDNAAGIFERDISRAFTPAVPPSDASGLSQFGIGMKAAGCWFAKNFEISTTALGEDVRRSVTFDVPELVATSTDKIPVETTPANHLDHGTRLTLWNLNQKVPVGRTIGKIRDYLRSIYRSFLDDPQIEIIINHERLEIQPIDILEAARWDNLTSPPLTWKKNICVTLSDGRNVTGFAGLRSIGGRRKTGFALKYRDKIVQGADVFAGQGEDAYKPDQIFKSASSFIHLRLFGELDVSEVGVTYSKDSVTWDDDVEQEFIDLLEIELDKEPLPLLRMAAGHRKPERSRSVQRRIVEATENVARASLSFVEQELSPGFDPFIPDDEIPHLGLEEDEAPNEDPLWSIRQSLGTLEPRHSGANAVEIVLEVVDTDDVSQWVRLITNTPRNECVIQVNRNHPYILSFANLPATDIEPALRLAVAIGFATLKARRAGIDRSRFFLDSVNQSLKGDLAKRLDNGWREDVGI